MAERKVLFNHPYFTITEDSTGSAFVHSGDQALVVPLTPRKEIILIAEPSPAFGGETLVIPGGEVDGDEPPYMTAQREMQEEIGYAAGRLDPLGVLRMDAKYNTRKVYVYLARDLMPSRRTGDENYTIRLGRLPFANFEKLIANGRLTDSSTIAALYMAQSFMKQATSAARRK